MIRRYEDNPVAYFGVVQTQLRRAKAALAASKVREKKYDVLWLRSDDRKREALAMPGDWWLETGEATVQRLVGAEIQRYQEVLAELCAEWFQVDALYLASRRPGDRLLDAAVEEFHDGTFKLTGGRGK